MITIPAGKMTASRHVTAHGKTDTVLHTIMLCPLVCAMMMAGCGVEPTDPELRQAARAMHQMTTRSILSRSCFYVAYPDGSPSDFVDYLFSPLGAAEWPPRDGRTAPGEELSPDQAIMRETMAFEAEQAKAAGLAVLPGSVRISRMQRRDPTAKELVLRPDDSKGVVVATGYMANQSEPVTASEWKLPTGSPDQGVRQVCNSNIEMGIGIRP